MPCAAASAVLENTGSRDADPGFATGRRLRREKRGCESRPTSARKASPVHRARYPQASPAWVRPAVEWAATHPQCWLEAINAPRVKRREIIRHEVCTFVNS